jgi:methylamine dehydrogenase heavy chain
MHMIPRHAGRALRVLALAAPLAWAPARAEPAPALPAETLTTAGIDAAAGERIYVADVAISHIADGRIRVFDARRGRLLGMLSTGFVGNFSYHPQTRELYVATTYLSRSSRGERNDVLEVHDADTLAFKYEVMLPPKRAQALNHRGLVTTSGDGRFVLVQNATPATSISVVNLEQRSVVAEVPTPGCWGILPSASHGSRFSMLCGDGRVATVTLGENGQPVGREVSDKLFDADADAWFHHAERVGDRYWFLSFQGTLTELDLGGPVALVKGSRSLVGAAGRKSGWRPGGYQPFAVDPTGAWLVVAMHDKGQEGSHKRVARQLWTVDLATGQRGATSPGHKAVALTFSRDGQRLHALDGEAGSLSVWQWGARGKLKPITTVARAGEASTQIESHD